MQHDSEKSYPELNTLTEGELDANSSYRKMLDLVGESARVLDVGCASGYLARLLSAHGCRVTGIDISPKSVEAAQQYCERALVADLDAARLTDLFPDETFDVVVFGDVLEHLRDPWQVLDDARRLLAYRGSAVVSIPNIAHGAIRLALLRGHFDYSEFGILDNTHLRFFTRRTVEELFVQCGYEIERVEKTILPLFAPTNLVPELNPADFDAATISNIRLDVDFETLQFVVKAKALDDQAKLAAITQRYLSLNAELEAAKEAAGTTKNFRLSDVLSEANAEIELQRETIDRLKAEQGTFRELQKSEAELQLVLADVSDSIAASVRELEARIKSSDDELRFQRQAYDDLCGQVATARRVVERAEPFIAFESVISRNQELSDALRDQLALTERYRILQQSLAWRAAAKMRRVLLRLRNAFMRQNPPRRDTDEASRVPNASQR